jgi:DNA-binding MarR family transcriptional regulator
VVTEGRATGADSGLTGEAERLRLVMIRLRRQLHRRDTLGLSIELYSALATVVFRKGLSMGDLALAEHLPPSAATRLVDRLEEAGLVVRRPNSRDRRGVLLEATAEGRQRLAERRRIDNIWLADRLGRLTREQRSTVSRALDALEAVVLRDPHSSEVTADPPSTPALPDPLAEVAS